MSRAVEATYFSAGPADANASSGSGGMPDDFLPSTSFTELGVVLGDGMTRWGEVANFSLHLQGGEEILLEPVPLVRAVAHWEPEVGPPRLGVVGGLWLLSWQFEKLRVVALSRL